MLRRKAFWFYDKKAQSAANGKKCTSCRGTKSGKGNMGVRICAGYFSGEKIAVTSSIRSSGAWPMREV